VAEPPRPDRAAARIGLFGGTFDPVHHGHLRSALELRGALALDTVRLLPNHRPAHRGPTAASSADRLAMLEQAVQDVPGLQVDARELLRDGPSYTVDTLEALSSEHPHTALVFFMGLDAFNHFVDWHRPERILQLAHLVVIDRPGATLAEPAAALLQRQRVRIGQSIDSAHGARAGVIERRSLTRLDISATRIRRDVAAGLDVRFLLPAVTRAYILDKCLYCTDSARTLPA